MIFYLHGDDGVFYLVIGGSVVLKVGYMNCTLVNLG